MTRTFNYECPGGDVTLTIEGDGDTADMIIAKVKMLADIQNRMARRECRCNSVSFYEVKDKDIVTIICYGMTEKMTRKAAIAKYTECMAGSEGSERDRYLNIYLDLKSGKKICNDERR